MNYKSAQARLLSIFLVIGVFFVTILNWEFTVNAQINDNHSSAFNIENDDYNGTCVGKTRISLVSSKKHFLWEENILATYYVSSNESIADISYTQTGFNVISVGVDADNPKYIVVELSCIPTAEEYSMSIQITLDSAKTITARLYAIKNEHGVFISPFSEDDAYQRYFDYAREANIMNEDDYKTIKTALNRIGVTENVFVEEKMVVNNEAATMATNSKTTYIKGTLQWTDDKNNVHPLRGVMVKIYDDEPIGEQLLTTLYTDDEGYYYYSFSNPDDILDFENGGYDIFIRIYAGNDNVMVEFGDNREEYYYPSCVIENIITGSTVTRNINFSMQTDLGNAFQISQALIIAYSYTNVMMEESPMPLTS